MRRFSIATYLFAIIAAISITSCENTASGLTSDGFVFEVHTSNDTARPQPSEYVYFEMDITGETGEVIQSMKNLDQMPVVQIPAEGTIPERPSPIVEILSQMSIGDSATMYVPVDSLPSTSPELKDFQELRYEIVLRDIKDEENYELKLKEDQERLELERTAIIARLDEVEVFTKQVLEDYKSGALDGDIVEDESGLKYVIHEKGEGEIGKEGYSVSAHYYGILEADGKMFDTSFSRGVPFSFTLGRRGAIDGWDIGFQRIPKGSKATLFVPYDMAYGEAGRAPMIPEKANLVFYVELLD